MSESESQVPAVVSILSKPTPVVLEEATQDEKVLSPNSTINEVFEHIKVEEGVNVFPITIKQDPKDTRLLLIIQGEHQTASSVFAEIMLCVDDLFATSNQPPPEPKKRIIVPNG